MFETLPLENPAARMMMMTTIWDPVCSQIVCKIQRAAARATCMLVGCTVLCRMCTLLLLLLPLLLLHLLVICMQQLPALTIRMLNQEPPAVVKMSRQQQAMTRPAARKSTE
jgi:hypothetical protein